MDHPISCKCGAVKGKVLDCKLVNRAICYCTDCQAFAHYLGHASEILDEQGGSDIIQTAPGYLEFTQGLDKLACIRLTPKGLVRWYASCCNTPIGNTMYSNKVSFIGLVHNCLDSANLDSSFGPVRAVFNAKSARGDPKPKDMGNFSAILRISAQILGARLNGSYKQNPLFNRTSGTPIAQPKVLDETTNRNIRDQP